MSAAALVLFSLFVPQLCGVTLVYLAERRRVRAVRRLAPFAAAGAFVLPSVAYFVFAAPHWASRNGVFGMVAMVAAVAGGVVHFAIALIALLGTEFGARRASDALRTGPARPGSPPPVAKSRGDIE
jgi:hypothetical protein